VRALRSQRESTTIIISTITITTTLKLAR